MAGVDPEDIWIFIYKKGEVRYTDLINNFKETGKCAKQTLINYKLKLESEGKIAKRISEKTNRPVYYVPDEWRQEVKILMEKKEMKRRIDKLTPKELMELREEFYREFIK